MNEYKTKQKENLASFSKRYEYGEANTKEKQKILH